jgi:hypothetical protein
MRFMSRFTRGLFIVLGCLAVPSLVAAEEIQPAFAGIPAQFQDRAFDQFASPLLLGEAWQKQDPAMLADAGLALAEGERVLLRTHKKLSADTVLRFAIALAGEQGDQPTLARLARAEAITSRPALVNQLESERKRAAEMELSSATATGESVTGQLLFVAFRQDVREVRLTKDAKTLAVLREIAQDLPSLSATQRQQVADMLKADVNGHADHARLALRYYQLTYQAQLGVQPRHFLRTMGVLEQVLASGKGPSLDPARQLHERIIGYCKANDVGRD